MITHQKRKHLGKKKNVIVDSNELEKNASESGRENAIKEEKEQSSSEQKDKIEEKEEVLILPSEIKVDNQQKPTESKEGSAQLNETNEPKVKVTSTPSKINSNRDHLASSQKRKVKSPLRSEKSEKKPVVTLDPADQLSKAFAEDPVLLALNLLEGFLKPILPEDKLEPVKNSLQKTVELIEKHKKANKPLKNEEEVKERLKTKSLDLINQLKTDEFKGFLNCLGKKNSGETDAKSSISRPLNNIQKDTKTLGSLIQKNILMVDDLFELEGIHVNEKNKGKGFFSIKEKQQQLSEKIQDLSTKLTAAFFPLTPTKITLKSENFIEA